MVLRELRNLLNSWEGQSSLKVGVAGKPYDLILLDIMMPEMDGQEVVKEVRRVEEEKWGIIYPKGIKIIMTTALDDPKNVVTAFKSLYDAYLVKPVTEESLLTAIREFFPDFTR